MKSKTAQTLIKFPVSFNLLYGKIYDARNFEVATVKTFATNDETRLQIGDFIASAMNEANEKIDGHRSNRQASEK